MIIVLLIIFLPTVLSIPAFYILRKKRRIFIFDYGIGIYATIYLFILAGVTSPIFSPFGFSDVAAEPFFVGLFSLSINYIKIFIPKTISTKIISFLSITILFLLTTLLFFFFPKYGE